MKIGQMFSGNYLKASDIDEQLTVKIESVDAVSMKDNTGQEVTKPLIHFANMEHGLVLNKTNAKLVCKALGSDDTDDWIGRKITLYVTDVEFRGDIVPAIRVRAKSPEAKKAQPVPDMDLSDDDIPF